MIVAFTGKMGAGKNTAASMVNFIVNGYTFKDWDIEFDSNQYKNLQFNNRFAKYLLLYKYQDFKHIVKEDVLEDIKMSVEVNPGFIFFEEKSFAAKIKDMAAILTGLPRENFDNRTLRNEFLPCPGLYDPMVVVQNSFKGITFANLHNYTYRTFLQRLGTEAMRQRLHQDIWVNALMFEYLPLDPEKRRSVGNVLDYSDYTDYTWPGWVITDLRFNNEAVAVREREGVIIEIVKLNVEHTSTHGSEEGIDHDYINYTIQNDGTYEDLFNKLQQLKNILLYERSSD